MLEKRNRDKGNLEPHVDRTCGGVTSCSITVLSWLITVCFCVLLVPMPSPPVSSPRLTQHDERLPFFDDVRGELRRVAAADILRRMDLSGRDEQDLAGLKCHRRLAVDLILQQAFDDVGDLFARMTVRGERRSRGKVDAHLDELASGGAEIVSLEIGAPDSRLLRLRHV